MGRKDWRRLKKTRHTERGKIMETYENIESAK